MMSKVLLKKLLVAALVVAGVAWMIQRSTSLNIGIAFILYLLGGTAIALVLAKMILPRIGEAVAGFVLSSGGRLSEEEMAASALAPKAVAMLARGDFKGALNEYEFALHRKPDDLHTIAEIAKIQATHLEHPEIAVSFLKEQLASRQWPMDGEAFILFRLAEVHEGTGKNRAEAEEVLHQIQARFPQTCHSANARDRLAQWHEASLREEMIRRRKAEIGTPS